MANGNIIFKTVLLRGASGQAGQDVGNVPTNGIIYYDGTTPPQGYELADAPIVELTQSQYDALPSSKNSDNIIYFIKD